MLENNVARIIFFIGGLIVLGVVIPGIIDHWNQIKELIDLYFLNKASKM